MARLESVYYVPFRAHVCDGRVEWMPVASGQAIPDLPQIFWADGTPWREANLWAIERATAPRVELKTVHADMTCLRGYASWLELPHVAKTTKWWSFPRRHADKCLTRFRKFLVDSRDEGRLAPSTVSTRMAGVIRFYRWLDRAGLLSTEWPMWADRVVGIRLQDRFGFDRTISATSTDVSIPNRRPRGEVLEGGLLPVSASDRDAILAYAQNHATHELFLMLALGFFTGMRLGTIGDLRVQTIERAAQDPASSELLRLAVGPRAKPQVHTKFGVSGQVWLPKALRDELLDYAYSVRRLTRQGRATGPNRDLLFLTRYGNSYAERGTDRGPAMNTEMHKLRGGAVKAGVRALRNFNFHRSRCTFATELARMCIPIMGAVNAIGFIKDALLHANESDSIKYIRFVERTPAKEAVANAFTSAFLGLVQRAATTGDTNTGAT